MKLMQKRLQTMQRENSAERGATEIEHRVPEAGRSIHIKRVRCQSFRLSGKPLTVEMARKQSGKPLKVDMKNKQSG